MNMTPVISKKEHPLYSMASNRVLGKFKSETGSVAPKEFVGLCAENITMIYYAIRQ